MTIREHVSAHSLGCRVGLGLPGGPGPASGREARSRRQEAGQGRSGSARAATGAGLPLTWGPGRPSAAGGADPAKGAAAGLGLRRSGRESGAGSAARGAGFGRPGGRRDPGHAIRLTPRGPPGSRDPEGRRVLCVPPKLQKQPPSLPAARDPPPAGSSQQKQLRRNGGGAVQRTEPIGSPGGGAAPGLLKSQRAVLSRQGLRPRSLCELPSTPAFRSAPSTSVREALRRLRPR